MLTSRDLTPRPPVPPDFSQCDPWYGFIIEVSDCQAAAEQLPSGGVAVPYFVNNPVAAHRLPLIVTHETCTIEVQVAGPDLGGPPYLQLVPDEIRGSAAHVIQQCSSITDISTGWCGGFVTSGLSAVTNYLHHEGLPPNYESNVSDLRFVTVTIRGSSVPRRHPGDDEPNVAQRLAMDVHRFSRYLPPNSLYFHYARIMTALMDRFHQMINPLHSGHRPTWWEATPTPPDEMTYECDASLGSPAVGDCSRLLLLQQGWGGGRLSDTVQVSPGAPKTLVSNTCAVTISTPTASSSSQIVLLASQILAALTTLVNTCIINNDGSASSSSGGRAYYQIQPDPGVRIQDIFRGVSPSSSSSSEGTNAGKIRRRDAGSSDVVSGLNALPPRVNMTVYRL